MNQFRIARAICLSSALLAAGCAPGSLDSSALQPFDRQAEPVLHDVHFAPGMERMSPAEGASLAAFLRRAGAHPGDTAIVAGDETGVGAARRARVIEVVRSMGLAAKSEPTHADRAAVTVTLEGVTAFPFADCPYWQVMGSDSGNAPGSNFGCASSANLYLMVADPRDLVAGREPGPADAEPGMRAVKVYREGVPTAPAAPIGGGAPATTASGGAAPGAASSSTTSGSGGILGQP